MRTALFRENGIVQANDTTYGCSCDQALISTPNTLIHGSDGVILKQAKGNLMLRVDEIADESLGNAVHDRIVLCAGGRCRATRRSRRLRVQGQIEEVRGR